MERYPQPVTHLNNATVTAGVTGTGVYFDTSTCDQVAVFIDVGEVETVGTVTSSKLEVSAEVTPDWGTTWYDAGQLGEDITAAVHDVRLVPSTVPLGSGMRLKWLSTVVATVTKQVETATAVGTITKAGNAKVTVKSALFDADVVVAVPVEVDDDASAVAAAIRTALAADADIAAHFTVSGTAATAVLTVKVAAANDTTLNIAIDNDTCEGITTAATSADTTAGAFNTVNFKGVKIRSCTRNT